MDVQAAAARAIIDYGAGHDEDLQLSDEQIGEVERGMADPNRKFLSLTAMRNRLRPLERMRLVVDATAWRDLGARRAENCSEPFRGDVGD